MGKAVFGKHVLTAPAAGILLIACGDVYEPAIANAQPGCVYQVIGTTVPNTSGSPMVINKVTGTVISANFFASGAIDPIDGQEYVSVCIMPPDHAGKITATISSDIGRDDDTQIKGYPQFLIGTKFGNQYETSFGFYPNTGLPLHQQWPVKSTNNSQDGTPYQLANLEYIATTRVVGLPAFTHNLPDIEVSLDIDEFNVVGAERDIMLESWFYDTAANANKLGLNQATGEPIANTLNNIVGIGHPHYDELDNTLLEMMVHIGPLSPNDVGRARRNPGQQQLTENFSGKDFDGDGIDDHFDVDSHSNVNNSQQPRPGIYSSGLDANGDGIDDADILPVTIGTFQYSIWYGTSHLAPIVIFSRETNSSLTNDFDPLTPDMDLTEEGEFNLHWNDFLEYTLYELEQQLQDAGVSWAIGSENPFPKMRASSGAIGGLELGIEPQTNNPDDLPYHIRLNKFDVRVNGRTLGLVDGIPPVVQADFPLNTSELTPTTTDVTGHASDHSSGIASVLVRIQRDAAGESEFWNGSTWQALAYWNEAQVTNERWVLSSVDLNTPGQYRILTRAYDVAGNHATADGNPSTNFTIASTPPEITNPTQSINNTNETFNWTNNETPVSHYWLYLGTSVGDRDIYDSKNLGNATSHTIAELADYDDTVYARLWYRETGSTIWKFTDAEYESIRPAHYIIKKTNGTSIAPFAETFEWNPGADYYWVYAGSDIGSSDYYDSGNLGALTSTSITNLPYDGESLVHVRLWFRNSGNRWRFTDHTYISGQASPPSLIFHLRLASYWHRQFKVLAGKPTAQR